MTITHVKTSGVSWCGDLKLTRAEICLAPKPPFLKTLLSIQWRAGKIKLSFFGSEGFRFKRRRVPARPWKRETRKSSVNLNMFLGVKLSL